MLCHTHTFKLRNLVSSAMLPAVSLV
ncbi:hypothetical protein CR513_16852 [Mucuna pruriens]|uniref:Uncharacterized protein n=1 Tax=Mucuna pruriens TaxID=157652 RepID=A0A371HBA2_MUCPR|nr:hypothetical protein CR513_16852 [Mucuna pruriens]